MSSPDETCRHPDAAVGSPSDWSLSAAETNRLLAGIRSVLTERRFAVTARDLFHTCKELTGATAGYIALLAKDGTNNDVLFLDAGGRECLVDPSLPMPLRGLRAEAYARAAAVSDNDFSGSAWVRFMPAGHMPIDNVLFAPLTVNGKPVGLIGLANKPGGFSERDVQVASTFGQLAAVALHRSRLSETIEASVTQHRSLVEAASDAIVTIDDQGAIITWNAAAETIFGYPEREIVGHPLTRIMPPRFHSAHRAALRRAAESEGRLHTREPIVFAGLTRDGREFPVELSIASWHADERTFFTGILRDISARTRAEEELQAHRRQLEELVHARTDSLERAIEEHRRTEEQLRESVDRQAVLAREVNHRVRNNLSEILALLQHEQTRLDAAGCNIGARALRGLEYRVRGLAAVHDLLSAGNWRPLALSDLCAQVLRSATAALPADQHVETEVSPTPIRIASDRAHQFALVLNELVTNSVKHGLNGQGALRIAVAAAVEAGQIVLRYRDNGPGFPAAVLRDHGTPMGTGLQLIQGIVGHSLGGTVQLGNDGGGTVEIRFPAADPAATESEQ